MSNPKSSSEADLITRISSGDEQAFVALYDRFSRPLYSMALKILQNPEDAEDVLQQAFLQVWRKAGNFQPGRAGVFTWLVIIIRSKAIDRMRQRLRQSRLSEEQAQAQPLVFEDAAAQPIEDQDRSNAIKSALATLPDEQRNAIEMAFFKGLTQTEISDALATPLGTIKARIRRGMLRLRDSLVL